jgi:hypothetical protein
MSYPQIISAVNAAVTAANAKLFDELKAFIVEEIDEESAEAITALFDKFKEEKMSQVQAVEPKAKKAKKGEKADKEVKEKTKRAPSAYNIFVSEKMKELRAADSSLGGKDAMKQAMAMWKGHKAGKAAVDETPAADADTDANETSEASDSE